MNEEIFFGTHEEAEQKIFSSFVVRLYPAHHPGGRARMVAQPDSGLMVKFAMLKESV
jgi:hypothetical protein